MELDFVFLLEFDLYISVDVFESLNAEISAHMKSNCTSCLGRQMPKEIELLSSFNHEMKPPYTYAECEWASKTFPEHPCSREFQDEDEEPSKFSPPHKFRCLEVEVGSRNIAKLRSNMF